ncbi:MAG: hypothetical protein HY815_28825 [Candidatus Riflebacteria bacterium]|nr:hypothetical protein [Candidatus Riflebacteria bacterium]
MPLVDEFACVRCGDSFEAGYFGGPGGDGDYVTAGCLFCTRNVCGRRECSLCLWGIDDTCHKVCRSCADRLGILRAGVLHDPRDPLSRDLPEYLLPIALYALRAAIAHAQGSYACPCCRSEVSLQRVFPTYFLCNTCDQFVCASCVEETWLGGLTGDARLYRCSCCTDLRRRLITSSGELGWTTGGGTRRIHGAGQARLRWWRADDADRLTIPSRRLPD